MQTQFRISPVGTKKPLDLDIAAVNRALPSDMYMERQADGVYIIVETLVEEDESAQPRVQQELDRFFFLTCVRALPEMSRRIITADFPQSYWIHGFLPEGLGPQHWNPKLALQLRLWSAAVDIVDPPTQVLIFFQIIELEYPDTKDVSAYPPYSVAPLHRRTEAKLLRNIVAHAGVASSRDTKWYLKDYLNLEDVMMADRSNTRWVTVIAAKVKEVQEVAKDVIKSALNTAISCE